ncbi:MAG: cell division protein FtsB [Methylococcales bacterium]|nr:cell division protein FtsB [Methylococcales bacterium]
MVNNNVLRKIGITFDFVKILMMVLVLLILHLQYRLWTGDGNVFQVQEYQQRLDGLAKDVKMKKERNDALYAEVLDLRKGQAAIEERARYELGMIKENETFFQVLE